MMGQKHGRRHVKSNGVLISCWCFEDFFMRLFNCLTFQVFLLCSWFCTLILIVTSGDCSLFYLFLWILLFSYDHVMSICKGSSMCLRESLLLDLLFQLMDFENYCDCESVGGILNYWKMWFVTNTLHFCKIICGIYDKKSYRVFRSFLESF